MRTGFLFFIFFYALTGFGQEVFDYERKIVLTDRFESLPIDAVAHIRVAGTLIAPKSAYDKIVVIVPGSGPDTRHSHFVLAEKLLEQNTAVYRFDERGTGASGGSYSERVAPLAEDLGAAFSEMRARFPDKKIGIFAHSIGGVAAMELIGKGMTPDLWC